MGLGDFHFISQSKALNLNFLFYTGLRTRLARHTNSLPHSLPQSLPHSLPLSPPLQDLAEKEAGAKGHSKVKEPETSSAMPPGGVSHSATESGQDTNRSRSEKESGQGKSHSGTESGQDTDGSHSGTGSGQAIAPCGGPSPAGQAAGGGRPDSTLPSPDSKLDSILSRPCSTPKTKADLSIPRYSTLCVSQYMYYYTPTVYIIHNSTCTTIHLLYILYITVHVLLYTYCIYYT